MGNTVHNPYLPKSRTARAASNPVSVPQPKSQPEPQIESEPETQAAEQVEVQTVEVPYAPIESPTPIETIVEEPPAQPQERIVEVPVGTSFEVISWVDGDLYRAQAALAVEEQAEQPRKTLLRELRRITDAGPAQ